MTNKLSTLFVFILDDKTYVSILDPELLSLTSWSLIVSWLIIASLALSLTVRYIICW